MKTALMILQILLSLGLIAVVIAQSGHAAGISGAITVERKRFLAKTKEWIKNWAKLRSY